MRKVQNSAGGSCCAAVRSTSSTPPSAGVSHVLRFGVVVLITGTAFMLCASLGSFYMWKVSDKNVYNVRYSLNINGEATEGSVEIDSDNNLQRFQTGRGAGEAVEIHDFQIGITGIRFFGGDKCYIKSHIKANLPLMGAHNKDTLMFDLTDELMPVRFDEEFLIWVAAKQSLKNSTFLSYRILDLCGELPIFWLQPMYPKDGKRKKRGMQRAKRQLNMPEIKATNEERDLMSEQETVDEGQSAVGSGYNPENPYHHSGEAREESSMTFDNMLDHQGICCSECQRSYTHCQRVCEPLRGYWPWPYNYRGCQVACRVIMPCRWWVARILGVV
ncbi:leukocyte cell-derived chemotaxin 1 isoform X2 [Girardinichthys multiradiatus]|uniref:leukocyte cell-derived chemotaxin 1 isoform X2 n=1 Tax=Girardinichthys multiradiatus TaxID=208333 RepID=UPI001FABA4B3|nr:leukocyte cell-derived chemotaxin 1 isoform X2 [Girardinichthys multiradiatus]